MTKLNDFDEHERRFYKRAAIAAVCGAALMIAVLLWHLYWGNL